MAKKEEKKNFFYPKCQIDRIWNGEYNGGNVLGGLGMELTRSELEIMDVLWAAEQPLSRSDLLENTQNKSWKDSSVHILLNGMLQKGVIREAGFVKRSKTYGRTFEPTLTREEYYAATIFSRKFKPSVPGLIDAVLRREKITEEELLQIKQIISKL